MTLSTQTSKVSYAGDGGSTEFAVPFRFVGQTDLLLVRTGADGVESVLTIGTDYAVSGEGQPSGGSCTLVSAPAAGEKLTIYRDPEIVQETDYQENDPFPAETHEAALDLLTMIAQANRERVERAIKLPVSSELSGLTVPEPDAGRSLVWNGSGDGLENGPLADEITSAQGHALSAAGHAAQAVDAADAASASALSAQQSADLAQTRASGSAENIGYDNAASGLEADNAQAALDELAGMNQAKLDPDGDGSALAGLTLSQVTDAGTVCGLDVGTGADQVPTNSLLEGVPVGFVGWTMAETPPSGFLECDGAAVSRVTYAALFSAIGVMYGAGDGSATFNLPDLRGRFLRGWDHGAGTDPDAVVRSDRGDGTTGDNVGTSQADEYRSHTHGVKENSADLAGNPRQNAGLRNSSYVSLIPTTASGGNETRPTNINVLFCIKY